MWVTAFFLNIMLVTALGEYFETQFPWQLCRYPLALNTCDKSGYNEPIFQETLNLMNCELPRSSAEPFNYRVDPSNNF